MKATLDVLIPHFSDPSGLSKSLESIGAQTWKGGIRVVVFDDGSQSNIFEDIQEICRKHQKENILEIDVLRSDINLGRPAARNKLLGMVKSEYVSWLDAGDIWYPEKLRKQFDYMHYLEFKGANIDRMLITCSYDWEQEGKSRTLHQDVSGDQYKNLIAGESLRSYLWTLLGTAESYKIAGLFDERLKRLQDLDYFLSFVRRGGRIVSVPSKRALCCYYKNDVGRKSREVRDSYYVIYEKNRATLRNYPKSFLRMLNWKHDMLFARFAKANGNHAEYLKYLLIASLRRPKNAVRALFGSIRRTGARG